MNLKIRDIRLDFQPSENLDGETVQEYVDRLLRGDKLSPIRVRFDGTNYFCEDGFHRLESTRRIGRKTIEAEVRPGTLADMESKFKKCLEELKASIKESKSKKRR
jgi:hypothetical protein